MNLENKLSNISNKIDTTNLKNGDVIKIIPLEKLEKNPFNEKIYELNQIEELKKSIKMEGQLNPLIVEKVVDKEDKYLIISGHRRFEALNFLDNKEAKCIIVKYENELERQFALIEANSQRIQTKKERDKEIEYSKKILKELKNTDEEYKGININEYLANKYSLSVSTIKRTDEPKKELSQEEKDKKNIKVLIKSLNANFQNSLFDNEINNKIIELIALLENRN